MPSRSDSYAGALILIYKIGQWPVMGDLLFNTDINGHFQFVPN